MDQELTLQDILEDQIDTRAFDAPEPVKDKPRYRILKGEYIMTIGAPRIREQADERRVAVLVGKLTNEEGEYRGMVFPEISWQFRENRNGRLDLKSRLFSGLVAALQAPQGTPLPDFLEGITDETVRVYVSEYFRIPFADLLDEDKEGVEETPFKTYVFINSGAEGDAKAEHYLNLGFKSEGMVLSISAFESAVA
jgi:hypothetical protein